MAALYFCRALPDRPRSTRRQPLLPHVLSALWLWIWSAEVPLFQITFPTPAAYLDRFACRILANHTQESATTSHPTTLLPVNQPKTPPMFQNPMNSTKALARFALVLCAATATAATFRHQVNPALAVADGSVESAIISPDGSTVYLQTDMNESAEPEWYSVPAIGGSPTLLAEDGPVPEVEITSDGAYLVGKDGNQLHSLSTTTGADATLATLAAN